MAHEVAMGCDEMVIADVGPAVYRRSFGSSAVIWCHASLRFYVQDDIAVRNIKKMKL